MIGTNKVNNAVKNNIRLILMGIFAAELAKITQSNTMNIITPFIANEIINSIFVSGNSLLKNDMVLKTAFHGANIAMP